MRDGTNDRPSILNKFTLDFQTFLIYFEYLIHDYHDYLIFKPNFCTLIIILLVLIYHYPHKKYRVLKTEQDISFSGTRANICCIFTLCTLMNYYYRVIARLLTFQIISYFT